MDIFIDERFMSAKAKDAVRLTFNPSNNPRVTRMKMLAAAFITECETMAGTPAGREAAVAITNMQTASMWAVLGLTTPGLTFPDAVAPAEPERGA